MDLSSNEDIAVHVDVGCLLHNEKYIDGAYLPSHFIVGASGPIITWILV